MITAQHESLGERLRGLAVIASTLLDGDELLRIIAPQSYWRIANPDPNYKHLAGDFYDVDHHRFITWKKLLLRLGSLIDDPVDSVVWLRIPGLEEQLTVPIQNGTQFRFHRSGKAGGVDPVAEMAPVLERGDIVVLDDDDPNKTVAALGPIRNSMDEVIGIVQFCSPISGSRGLVADWRL